MLAGDAAAGARRLVNGAAIPATIKARVSNREARNCDRTRRVEELSRGASTSVSWDANPMARRQRSFLININFGTAQDSRSSGNRESQEYQRQRTLMTGNLLPLRPAGRIKILQSRGYSATSFLLTPPSPLGRGSDHVRPPAGARLG